MNWINQICKLERYYKQHALTRMVQRDISFEDIDNAIEGGKVIREYPGDTPLPSCLLLGRDAAGDPLHLVVAVDEASAHAYVITVYRPDQGLWSADYETKKGE